MLKVKDKIKVFKKPDNSNNWMEVGQGYVVNLSYGQDNLPNFIHFVDRDWPDSMISFPEHIAINALKVKVVKC